MNKVINGLIKDIKTTLTPSEVSRIAAEQLLGDITHRIHNEGKSSSNTKISNSYSSDPIYVSITGFVRKTNGKGKKVGKPRGKNSEDPKFKNGKQRKSRYFPDGYKGFQQEQTGNTQVNLVLTGALQQDLQVGGKSNNFGLTFGDYGLDIYKKLENKYSVEIWFPTSEEKDRMILAVSDYINKTLS